MRIESTAQLEGEKRPYRGSQEVRRCDLGEKRIVGATEGRALIMERGREGEKHADDSLRKTLSQNH